LAAVVVAAVVAAAAAAAVGVVGGLLQLPQPLCSCSLLLPPLLLQQRLLRLPLELQLAGGAMAALEGTRGR
jgi:hypothetical protein